MHRKAAAHVKRDRSRDPSCNISEYKGAIHAAVKESNGNDHYTGEPLAWDQISKYNNEESKRRRHEYKAEFAMLPTVDHIAAGAKKATFCICSWRTNDAKNDLSRDEFYKLCAKVLKHAGYRVERALVNC
ncbi:MAG: hypothetical protein HY286_12560 [Planctomycetes bacterium]|nr:hypothetical protein [Planctomycetota bacterium]